MTRKRFLFTTMVMKIMMINDNDNNEESSLKIIGGKYESIETYVYVDFQEEYW